MSFELDAAGNVVTPEGKTLEFKRDCSSPLGPMKTIVAFANSAGGQLVIGVESDGTVIGVGDPLAEEERIANLIADTISPQLVPAIDMVTIGDSVVLVVDVPLSTRRPHYLTAQGIDGGVYVRLGSSSRQADPALIAELERTARGTAFEDLPELRATINDLDLASLSELRGRQTEVEDLLLLGLAVRQGEAVVPTYAGILAACPDPTRFLPSAWVQCGRLRGANGTDIFDQIEVHGPIPRAADRVMEFLLKHAYKTAVFGEVRRRDEYSIPVEAIREVVVNALVHANYGERSTPIRVAFFDDRIQVDSPGLLVSGMTVEAMRRVSRLRNPSLARVFREAGIMEQWGTGIQRVFELVMAAGLPEPVIEEVVDRVRVTIQVPSHSAKPELAHSGEGVSKLSEQVSEEVSKLSEQVSEEVSKLDQQKIVILGMSQDVPQSRGELLRAIGLVDAYGNYRRHLLPLIEDGYLARTDPDKPNSRNQQYYTTAAGKAFLQTHQPQPGTA